MRVLYGVVGEGLGHAMRSRVVLEHLVRRGHQVAVMTSDRAVDYLQQRFAQVHRIHGLHVITEENRVRRGKTLWSNILRGAAAIPKQVGAYFRLIDAFAPDIVVSDFESWTYFYAKAHQLPVVSIDNMQILNRCQHDPQVLRGERSNFEIARAFVKAKLPFCDHYFVTTFFFLPVRYPRTTLHPPILRSEILNATPTSEGHLLVYQTAAGNHALADVLNHLGVESRVYGMRRALREDSREGALLHRPFNEAQFIEDLASARAVLTGGGFTLLGEALHLRKPVFSIPIEGYVEQILNGRYLALQGFGQTARTATVETLRNFLDALADYKDRLENYPREGNDGLFQSLDERLSALVPGR